MSLKGFLCSTLIFKITLAEVNVQFGEFLITHPTPLELLSKNFLNLNLDRSYSSRSLFRGGFGYGWCSVLDLKLILKENYFRLFNCNTQMLENLQDGTVTLTDQAIYKYKYQKNFSAFTLYFDSLGTLKKIETVDKKKFYLSMNSENQVTDIINDAGSRIQIHWNKQNLVSSIQWKKEEMIFKYKNFQLVNVGYKKNNNSPELLWKYEYDSYSNMTHWKSSNLEEFMSYDSEYDRIKKYVQSDFCNNSYVYKSEYPTSRIFHLKKCGPKKNKPEIITYEFRVKEPVKNSLSTIKRQIGGQFEQIH